MPESETDFNFKDLFIPLTNKKAIIFILIIGLLVYFNCLFNGFVGDDDSQIVSNPYVHSIINLPLFFRGSTMFLESTNQIGSNAGYYYKPILSTIYSVIYTIFGDNPFFFHLFQLLLHILNTALIFLIFNKFFKKKNSFILSLLFLLHPINNEAIVYNANLQDVLFSFFGLLSLKFFLEKKHLFFSSCLLLLSLFSKESGIIFFPIIITYYLLFSKKTKKNTGYLLLSLTTVLGVYVVFRVFIGNIGLQTKYFYMVENASLLQRLFTIPSLLFYYLKMVLIPISPAFAWFWVVKSPTIINFGFPLIVVFMFLGMLLIPLFTLKTNHKLWKEYLFFFCTLIFSISISLQIFPLDFTVADRWFYVPLFGLLGMMGVVFESHLKKLFLKNHFRIWGIGILVIIIVLFSLRDFTRNFEWIDNLTLCGHDSQRNKESYILEYCYGNELYNIKNYDQAKVHALEAVKLYPTYFLSWYLLGNIYHTEEDDLRAEKAFENTLALNDFTFGAHELALSLIYLKKPSEAKNVVLKYLKILPNSAELWYAMALADYQLGDKKGAVTAAQKAYTLKPEPLSYKVYYRLSKNLPITIHSSGEDIKR